MKQGRERRNLLSAVSFNCPPFDIINSSCKLSSERSTAGDWTGEVAEDGVDFLLISTPLRLDEVARLATKVAAFLRVGLCGDFPFSAASFVAAWLGFSGTTILVVLKEEGAVGGWLFFPSVDFLRIGGRGLLLSSFFGDSLRSSAAGVMVVIVVIVNEASAILGALMIEGGSGCAGFKSAQYE